MASSTLVVKDRNLADVDTTSGGTSLDLVGNTATGAIYRQSAAALSTPFQVTFDYKIGEPGAMGNDKLFITVALSAANATTKVISTCKAKLEVSVPRDSATFADTTVQDVISYMASIIGKTAMRQAIVDGRVA